MNEAAAPGIQKVCARVNLREQQSDFAYWQSQPYQARLAALEEIRQEYHRWRYGAEPRLQKVCSIVKRQPQEGKQAAGRLQDLADLENLR